MASLAAWNVPVVLLALFVVYAAGQGSPYCNNYPTFSSRLENTDEPYVNLTILNRHHFTIFINWLDYDSNLTFIEQLDAGASVLIRTFPGHGFIAFDYTRRPVIIDYQCFYEVRNEAVQFAVAGQSPYCGGHPYYASPSNRQLPDGQEQVIIFYNDHFAAIRLIWLNYDGQEQLQDTLPALGAYQVNARNEATGWIARDESGNQIAIDRGCLFVPELGNMRSFHIIGDNPAWCTGVPHYNSHNRQQGDSFKTVNFVNEWLRDVSLYWINYDSTAQFYGTWPAGKAFEVNTYPGDGWMVKDAILDIPISVDGRCLFIANYDRREAVAVADKSCERSRYVSPNLEDRLDTNITFVNHDNRAVRVYWIDYNGTEQPYGTLPPGSVVVQPSRESHGWVARVAEPASSLNPMVRIHGQCIYIADGSFNQVAYIGDLM